MNDMERPITGMAVEVETEFSSTTQLQHSMDKTSALPFSLKLPVIVVGVVAFFFILDVGQQIILPLIYATIFAILLNPIVNYLVGKKVNRIVAILIALMFGLLVTAALIYFIASQAARFSDTLPLFRVKFNAFLEQSVGWVSHTFNVSTSKVNAWIAQTREESIHNGGVLIGKTLNTISGMLFALLLLPVYIFMFLFYKPLLLEFMSKLFPRSEHSTVAEVLTETKSLIQNYLAGLLIEAAIVATLNSAGLLVIGIDFAILLGVIGALLNIIPYVGGIIAISLPVLIALATKSPSDALLVVALYISVQFIDNNIIVPRIVASKVKINGLVSLVVVFIGSALWGIPGMFLSIPLTAIIKVIFDRIDGLKPWGFLVGDTMPTLGKVSFSVSKFKRKGSARAS